MILIQRYFFLFLNENKGCDHSLEPSYRDSSNGWSQHMFLKRNTENYFYIIQVFQSYLSKGTLRVTTHILKVKSYTSQFFFPPFSPRKTTSVISCHSPIEKGGKSEIAELFPLQVYRCILGQNFLSACLCWKTD